MFNKKVKQIFGRNKNCCTFVLNKIVKHVPAMEVLSTDTEQLIKDTAKKVFFKDGKLHATTQDIADAAGINRASIHYYYRSRKLLFDKVFAEATEEMHVKMAGVISQNLPFRQLIEGVIDAFLKKSVEHPYLELFLITEMNTDPNLSFAILSPEETEERKKMIQLAVEAEVAAGTTKPIEPEHFIANMMSLCAFPFLGKPMIQKATNLNDDGYAQFLQERKEVILKLLFLDR